MTNLNRAKYDVVVLIPHFNNLSGLRTSIQSIYSNYKPLILIVDDGSADELKPQLDDLQAFTNYKIKLILLHNNYGIENALNTGLVSIERENLALYVARLDCGDTMDKNRIDLQIDLLNKNSDISLVGSDVEFRSNGKKQFRLRFPSNYKKIRNWMFLKVCFIHPAVMFRLSVIETVGPYPTEYPAAEDYAFFMRIIKHFKTASIPQVLTYVENNTKGISISNRSIQLRSRMKVVLEYKSLSPYWVLGYIKLLLLLVLPSKIIFSIKRLFLK